MWVTLMFSYVELLRFVQSRLLAVAAVNIKFRPKSNGSLPSCRLAS
uniref:Uncharacterized protein n=1 Tax=Anguilla anguilla TaxID=7936 RepID=A0A0E9RU86_ANGAN